MKTAYFFLNNSLLGSGHLPEEVHIRSGQIDRPRNTAYFCSRCGEIWGRLVVSSKQDFKLRLRNCAQHGSGLFQDYSSPLWQHYPKEVLYRELSLIAAHLERDPSLDFTSLTINWKQSYD